MPAFLFILLLVACESCAACAPKSLPSGNEPDPEDPENPDPDTADTGDPPPCTLPETEPNDSEAQAQALPLGDWACGAIDEQADEEFFRTTVTEPGWMRVWVRAAELGSTADVQLLIASSFLNEFGEPYTVEAASSRIPTGTDGRLVVPVQAGTDWVIQIRDEAGSFAHTHTWELIANMTKEPFEGARPELEPPGVNQNNAIGSPEPIESGEAVLGFVGDGSDVQDYYLLELPPGKSTIEARVWAWNLGSPLNSELRLFDPLADEEGEYTELATSGASSSDFDPLLIYTVDEGGSWKLRVRPQDGGGPLAWYVLEVHVVSSDTGILEEDGG